MSDDTDRVDLEPSDIADRPAEPPVGENEGAQPPLTERPEHVPDDEPDDEPEADFTHLNRSGRARMVDVGGKPDTARTATARGVVRMHPRTLDLIRSGGVAKGDVLAVAQVAGVMAAKRTPDIVPLCHILLLSGVDLDFVLDDRMSGVEITATVRTFAKTGAEMEALTAVSAAALTVYDMCKAVDREMTIDRVRLVYKVGGKSGEFRREDERRRFDDRPRGTWPQHPRRRSDEGEDEGFPRGPRTPYGRQPRAGPPPDQRRYRDDQRQGFTRPARGPWRPNDRPDRRGGRDGGR